MKVKSYTQQGCCVYDDILVVLMTVETGIKKESFLAYLKTLERDYDLEALGRAYDTA